MGRTVAMKQRWGRLRATKDEVSVARSVDLADKYKTIAPDWIKMVSRQMKRPGLVPPAAPVRQAPWPGKASRRFAKVLIHWK